MCFPHIEQSAPSMRLPRLQLFEFNDAAWAPEALKELIVESLSRTLRWGRVLRGIVGPLEALLAETEATEVLDLASGAGGPAQVLVEEIKRLGRTPPRFLLTDLQPMPRAWSALKALHPDAIDFVPRAVDATQIPFGLARGRVQIVINALHHFPPDLARAVLLGATRDAPGVFIAEGLLREPFSLAAIMVAGLPALFANPVLAGDRRLQKALLTWLSPAALSASLWDGAVSTLRQYTEEELREMVRDAPPGWRWDYGIFEFPFGGRGSWFRGVGPRADA
jgi:hypothetical protein